MPASSSHDQIRVWIAPDRSRAELHLPGNCPAEVASVDNCLALLRGEGVELTPAVQAAVESQLAASAGAGPRKLLVAQATAPAHGQDGRIDWLIDQQRDQHHQQADYYNRCAFVMVKAGQVLGQVVPPTPGADGRDVLGQNLPAKAGKPAAFRVNESVLVDGQGQLLAQQDGALIRQGEKIAIRQALEIRDHVDFSTGNIDFAGDITVHKGVRDLFVVKATGGVEVGGLIEAATIDCGGDLLARGGFAGRTRGTACVGGNLIARYLDNVRGHINGDLVVEREAINCDLTVHGQVRSPQGSIIGGRLLVVGKCEIATAGSPAYVETDLILGSVPRIEQSIAQLRELTEQLEVRCAALAEEERRVNMDRRRRTAADKERLTELMFELQTRRCKLAQAQGVLEALRQRLAGQRTIDLLVQRLLHVGVRVLVGDQAFQIVTDVRGPLRISRDDKHEIVYRPANGVGGLLTQIAEVKARDV